MVAATLERDIAAQRIAADPIQMAAALRLDDLSRALRKEPMLQKIIRRTGIARARRSAPRGIYLCGGVGRGGSTPHAHAVAVPAPERPITASIATATFLNLFVVMAFITSVASASALDGGLPASIWKLGTGTASAEDAPSATVNPAAGTTTPRRESRSASSARPRARRPPGR